MAKKRKVGGSVSFPDAPGTASKKQKSSGPPAKKGPQGKQPGQQGLANRAGKKKQHQQYHRNQEPVVPLEPHDNILLVGEGDLSLAASLAVHHGCRNLTATVLEKSEAELLEKYPHARENIAKILRPGGGGDGERGSEGVEKEETEEEENGDFGSDGSDSENPDQDQDSDLASSSPFASKRKRRPPPSQGPNRNRILYNTDATTLKAFTTTITNPTTTSKGAPPPLTASEARPYHKTPSSKPDPKQGTKQKPERQKRGIFSRIIFNFPHVGGKSTDVNRQVRHNQSLLVAFFQRALPSLAPGGSIIVTLFEGEPYTLWNVRDLARHAGLAFDRSFRFPWSAYPGYRHARTLGVVRSRGDRRPGGSEKQEEEEEKKSDESDEEEEEGRPSVNAQVTRQGESKTAWKGEERAARSYVFVRKEELEMANAASKKNEAKKNKKKKKRNQDADDSDSDSDVSD